MLHVMAGDQFDISAQSYLESDTTGDTVTNPNILLKDLLSTLTPGGSSGAVWTDNGSQKILQDAINPNSITNYENMVETNADPNIPQAFINYMAFDENMKLIPSQSGAIQVSNVAGQWEPMGTTSPIKMAASGYLLIYIENLTWGDVWVDHLNIHLYEGTLIQEQDYYPYGLPINVGNSTTIIPNKFKYQGKEMQDDLNLDLDDFGARQYDHQIGRFCSLDPASQFPSGYTGMGNDPANMVDPSGLSAVSPGGTPYDAGIWSSSGSGGNGHVPLFGASQSSSGGQEAIADEKMYIACFGDVIATFKQKLDAAAASSPSFVTINDAQVLEYIRAYMANETPAVIIISSTMIDKQGARYQAWYDKVNANLSNWADNIIYNINASTDWLEHLHQHVDLGGMSVGVTVFHHAIGLSAENNILGKGALFLTYNSQSTTAFAIGASVDLSKFYGNDQTKNNVDEYKGSSVTVGGSVGLLNVSLSAGYDDLFMQKYNNQFRTFSIGAGVSTGSTSLDANLGGSINHAVRLFGWSLPDNY